MGFKKNTAVTALKFNLISKTDGSDITTGIPIGYVSIDGGVQTAIADVSPVHLGNGEWKVNLTSAEMNGTVIGLTFVHTSAITVPMKIKTEISLVSDITTNITNILADTNELQLNQGNWLTATGFSTFNPAVDNVIIGTNNDKTGYNLTQVFPINFADLSITATTGQVTSYNMRGTDSAMLATSYTAPDNVSITTILADTNELQTDWTNNGRLDLILDSIKTDTSATIPNLINLLNNVSSADVKTAVLLALGDPTIEPTAVPSDIASIVDKLSYIFSMASNKINQTATLQSLRNKTDTLNISTAPVTSDGTTTSRGTHI